MRRKYKGGTNRNNRILRKKIPTVANSEELMRLRMDYLVANRRLRQAEQDIRLVDFAASQAEQRANQATLDRQSAEKKAQEADLALQDEKEKNKALMKGKVELKSLDSYEPPNENEPCLADTHDVILLALSILGNQLSELSWQYKEEMFSGCIGQMECVVRHFIKNSDKDAIKVVVLCTEETEKTLSYDRFGKRIENSTATDVFSFSSYDFFRHRIRTAPESRGKTISFFKIKLLEDDVTNALRESVKSIKESINDNALENKLYIDTHGSFREVSLLMNAIIFLLGKMGSEPRIIPVQICGVDLSRQSITDQTDTYNIFDFVTGISDFTNFGNADVLSGKFDQEDGELTKAMQEVSLAIQLCDPEQYTIGLKRLNELLNKYGKNNSLLNIFSEELKEDYGKLLARDLSEEERDFWIIHRCLDKKLYQQALTIIEAKMPFYYFKNNLLYYDEKFEDTVSSFKPDSFNWQDNIAYIFNTYLSNCCRYSTQGQRKNNGWILDRDYVIDAMVAFSKGRDYYRNIIDSFYISNNYELINDNGRLRRRSDIHQGETVVVLKTNAVGRRRTDLGYAIRMHKALKDYRNIINHASSDRKRVSQETLENVIRKYLQLVEDIVDPQEA